MGRGIVIRPDDVRQIAALVELDVPDEDLPRLAAEMERICDFVAQMDAAPPAEAEAPAASPPVRLRPDRPSAGGPAAELLRAVAPPGALREGFYLVPRLRVGDDG